MKQAGITETEEGFQNWVINTAHVYGWKVAHFRPARTEKGWRTPVSADGAGFPDLVLTRDRVIFIEVKSERGRLSEAQKDWLARLSKGGVEAWVVRPSEREFLEKQLAAPCVDRFGRR